MLEYGPALTHCVHEAMAHLISAYIADIRHELRSAIIHRDVKPGNIWLTRDPSSGSGRAQTAKLGGSATAGPDHHLSSAR